jgi:hypothetical protein
MIRQTARLGRIFGISIGVDHSRCLILVLMTWLLAKSYFPSQLQHWRPLDYWGHWSRYNHRAVPQRVAA